MKTIRIKLKLKNTTLKKYLLIELELVLQSFLSISQIMIEGIWLKLKTSIL